MVRLHRLRRYSGYALGPQGRPPSGRSGFGESLLAQQLFNTASFSNFADLTGGREMPLTRDAISGELRMDVQGDLIQECGPSSCPSGLASSYGFPDYSDGDLQACDDELCSYLSYGTPWDGTFDLASDCVWEGNTELIDGRFIGTAKPILYLDTSLVCPRWDIIVYCALYPDATSIIWRGVKYLGNTPIGVYTRIDGCDITTAMSVVEVSP